MAGSHLPRHTARAIVVKDGNVLLMERWRDELHYFSIPGGGIEDGETPEEAAVREILEETSVGVNLGRQVFKVVQDDIVHDIFLAEYISGEPHLPSSAPENMHSHSKNRFKPGWFPIDSLDDLQFVRWIPVKQQLIDGLRNGFPDEITIVTA